MAINHGLGLPYIFLFSLIGRCKSLLVVVLLLIGWLELDIMAYHMRKHKKHIAFGRLSDRRANLRSMLENAIIMIQLGTKIDAYHNSTPKRNHRLCVKFHHLLVRTLSPSTSAIFQYLDNGQRVDCRHSHDCQCLEAFLQRRPSAVRALVRSIPDGFVEIRVLYV